MPVRMPLNDKEKAISYSKYYDLEMTAIPDEKLKILSNGPIDPKLALSIHDRNQLFNPGYLDCEVGYCIMPDGTGFLANHTIMPNVTAEMMDWWFAWHCLEDLRYRIWDPEDHFYARADNRAQVLDESLPVCQRSWGVTHEVLEDIGAGPDKLLIHFANPSDLGYEGSKIGTEYCSALFTANGESPKDAKNKMAAVMTHFVRNLEEGIELRSRFWIGYQIIDGQPVKVIPDGIQLPDLIPKGLFGHNLKEFTHLASILPQLYSEEKDNW